MNRRGAALLLVLWLLVLLTGLVAVSLGGMRIGSAAGRNRIELLRAAWAREACLEILLGRSGRNSGKWSPESLTLDSVDLGEGITCASETYDPGEYVNVNESSREALIKLTRDSVLADRLIARRPWFSPEAIRDLPGIGHGPLPAWLNYLTVKGTGRINLNRAPIEVLQTLPGVDLGAARFWSIARRSRPFRSIDDVLYALPPGSQRQVLAQYQTFAILVTTAPEQFVVLLSGRARDGPLSSRATITLASAGTRLAVIRRETD